MRFSRRFFARPAGLRDRLVKALQQARDGDLEGAVATVLERFPQAFLELQASPSPGDIGWLRLCAWLAYRAADMPAAADFARRALTLGEDAQTWNLLARVGIWLADASAETAFRKAAALAPRRYVVPVRVSHERFRRLAADALEAVPEVFQERLSNTMIVVDDLPDLDAVRDGEDPDLLGLYEGATVLEQGLPERIVLYQRNHENVCATLRQLEREVTETMRHEIGHHFGLREDELPY
jgi:predicted Zn-dependent protease with MMP-like domain